MISLIKLIMEQDQPVQGTQTAPSTAGGQPLPPGAIDYNISSDFSSFETRIANATEQAKAAFLRNLNSRLVGKKVSIQASKGYGQPVRDYSISVTSASLDYFYDRYVVILKDENDKEYFLKTGFKITILGVGDPLKKKSDKKPKTPDVPVDQQPTERQPNPSTTSVAQPTVAQPIKKP
jgi:hypothetical protein